MTGRREPPEDESAGVTPEDVARAAESWRRLAPPEWRELLDARPVDGDEKEQQGDGA
jgi:hypothetical protein